MAKVKQLAWRYAESIAVSASSTYRFLYAQMPRVRCDGGMDEATVASGERCTQPPRAVGIQLV